MHSVILAPLFLLALGAAPVETNPVQAVDPARKCPPPVLTAAAPTAGGPARKLNEEPAGALIATVAVDVDGCPVMLVLDGGDTGAARGWTPVPSGTYQPIR